jgi:hypothetical protein
VNYFSDSMNFFHSPAATRWAALFYSRSFRGNSAAWRSQIELIAYGQPQKRME